MTGRSRARDRSRPSGGEPLGIPQQISGLVSWLDAARGTSGSPVDTWAGRVGPSCTQSTVANRPAAPAAVAALGGQLALAMDSTDRMIASTSIDLSAGWTIGTVLTIDALKNDNGLFRLAPAEASGSGGFCAYVVSAGHIVIANADTSWYKVAAWSIWSPGAFVILLTCAGTEPSLTVDVGTFSGSTITWSSRPLSEITGTFAMPASTGLYLVPGGGWSAEGSFLNGKFADQVVYNRALSAGEITTLKAYWKARFAP